MVINSKIAYVKKKEVFEPLINTIPSGLNPIVFIEDTREMWTCGTYFSIGYPSIEISETSGSVKVQIGNSFFLMSTTGDSISIRKGDGNRIIISSNALSKVDTEPPLEWDTSSRKLLHMESGVAPGSYGQSTSLGNASVFVVPNIVVDSTGHITYAQNYNVEIRDYVEQLAPSTLMGNRNVLLSYNEANENMDTSQVRKANGLYFNDATQKLTVIGGIDSDGPINVNHGDLTVVDGYIIGNLKGDVEGEAKPKIHLSDKPEYGGASINLYGHVKLQDVLNNQPEPSSDNDNINNVNVVNAIAASPLMVWNAIQTAKDYADSILGSNNAMLYKGSIEAGTKSPGTFTPYGQVGNTYVVTFGTGSYTDSIGYVNGEPVEIGDLLICREETPAATSATWEEIKSKWVYVQTNTTGVVSGPSSSLVGQLAIFNSTSGKLIKGLPNGNVGQMLVIGNSGIPEWVNKPDRLNYALSFQVRGTEFVSFDGYAEKKVNFIAGDNMFITSDAQGNLTLAADPGSDTVNTAGATNNINTKLFLIGAESQTTSPQTYSNQYVYIGPDNKLYSNGKEVSTADHNHDDRYVNTTGDTMTGALTINHSGINPIYLNSSSTEHCAISIKSNTSTKANFGWFHAWGAYMSDTSSNKYVNIKSDSLYWNNAYKFIHTGNYETTTDTRYVKKIGDTMIGALNINNSGAVPLAINSTYRTQSLMLVKGNGANKSGFGWLEGAGTYIYDYASSKYINIKSDSLYFNNTSKFWHAGNDGSGSGLDADLLDGVHYQNILEREFSKTNFISTIGWHRIVKTKRANGGGISFKLFLIRSYANSNNESYCFDISINYNTNTTSITQTSGYANIRNITKIRVTSGKNNVAYVDIYYSVALENQVLWTTIGCAESIDVESNVEALTYTTEFETTNGCKSSLGFVGELTGNATSATKLQTPRTIWGQSFDGTGNVSGDMHNVGSINASGIIKTTVDGAAYYFGSAEHYIGSNTERDLYIWGRGAYDFRIGTNDTERIRVTKNGNVGIGTDSPSKKLHVIGDMYASAGIDASGYVYSQSGWFQNNKSGCGLYNLAHDSRWYANSNGWYSDKAATFTGTVTSHGFKKSNSSDSYILLGGGGHKALSNIVGGSGQSNHGSSSTSYTADTYSSTYVNKSYAAFVTRGGWSYAGNGYITTDFGNIHLAGTAIFQWGANDTYKTQLFITPLNSSGVSSPLLGEMLYYSSNGNAYAAGWTRVLTSRNYSGILDSRYVNVTGDTMSGVLSITAPENRILTLNSSGGETDSYPYFELQHNGTRQGVYGASNNQPYFYNNGWQKIWHAGNDGSGSGLDADTVDGVHNGNLKAKYLVTEGDNRGTNTSPKDYINDIIFRGLKTNSAINSPNSDMYSYLVGLKGWADSSGGGSHELAFNTQGIYSRIATSETAWGAWKRLAYTTDTVAAANKLTVNAGSATRPVYFANGIPVAGTYTFGNANGNAAINNGTVCTNLNADLLDGKHASDFYKDGYVMFGTTIDASALDINTYYPVTFNIGSSQNVRIECRVALDSGTKPSWSTHSSGFSVRKIWETNGNGWGTNPINRRILVSDYAFTSTDPVRGIGQLTNSSVEYVYVRGGGKYYFYTSHNIGAILRTSTYTINGQSVSPTTSAPAVITRNIMMSGDAVSNADTVDGYHASYFPINTTAGNVDYNTITTSGIYRLGYTTSNGASNGPGSGHDFGQMLVLHGGGDTIAQLAFSYSDGGRMKVRAGNPSNVGGGGSWSSWKTIAFTTDKVSSASSADKLGTSTVGSGIKPIYLSSGTPTASSSSVGSTYVPVYLSSGTITSCGYSFKGSPNQPIVVAAGSIYKSGSTWYFSGVKHSSAGAVSITMSGARMQVSVPNTTICAANVNQSSTTTISGTSTSDLYGAGPSAYWFSAYCLNASYIYIRNMYQREKENHSWSSDAGGWNNISRISVIMVGYVS